MKRSKFIFYIIFNYIYRRLVTYEKGMKIKEKNKFDFFMEVSENNATQLFCEIGVILYDEKMKKTKK